MDATNANTSKAAQNPTMFCPWTSRTSTASSTITKHVQKTSEMAPNEQQTHKIVMTCPHKGHQLESNKEFNSPQCPSIQQSSSQFYYFLRLMQLFPDVHPATLHTVLVLCKNDFFCAVDKLIYAKKCKEMYNNRQNVIGNKTNRHQPYHCVHVGSKKVNKNENGVWQNYSQTTPIDVNSKNGRLSQNQTIFLDGKSCDTNKIVTKNILISVPSSSSNDLLPVASPKCQLPIEPLSPIASSRFSRELSSQDIILE